MRKSFLAALILPALIALSASPVAAAEEVSVMVMSHYCKSDIQSEADFEAVEAKGKGNPVAALAQTVLACPTSVNPGDASSNGVKDRPRDFSFTVESADAVADLPGNSTAAKLCETDIKLDANGDGKVSASVCLDISNYSFDAVDSADVTVTQRPATGFRFGTLRFTPPVIDKNNDEESLVSAEKGTIRLAAADDTDGMVMLHVYSFAGSKMPDSSTELAPASENAIPFGAFAALAAAMLAAGVAGSVFAYRRVR